MNSINQFKRDTLVSDYSGKDNYDMIIIGAGLSRPASGLICLKNISRKKNLIISDQLININKGKNQTLLFSQFK